MRERMRSSKSLFRRLASEMHYEEGSYHRRLHVSGSSNSGLWDATNSSEVTIPIPDSRVLVSQGL